jgi:hypothetical protein
MQTAGAMANPHVARNYLIRNQTPYRVVLKGLEQTLTLAPLQSRSIGADPISLLGDAALVAHEQAVIDWEVEPVRSKRLLWSTSLVGISIAAVALGWLVYAARASVVALLVGAAIGVGCAVAAAYSVGLGRPTKYETRKSHGENEWSLSLSTFPVPLAVGLATTAVSVIGRLEHWGDTVVAVSAGVAVLCAVRIAYLFGEARALESSAPGPPRAPFSAAPLRGDAWDLVRDFLIATTQGFVVVIVVVVAVAAPAMAIYYGTELSSVIVFKPWNHPSLVEGPDSQYIVVGRLLQLLLLILVSLVPALMYFQFDREKLTTLVDRWLHAIFRLDPSLETVSDVDARYGRRVEEFYGASLGLGVLTTRKRIHDRSPVVLCTLLIAIGWILVLLNQQTHSDEKLPTLQDLFRPSPTPMTLAFLGAYFLAVQVALRGYVRGDLKPKTYNVITVRILMAILLAWVMQALWGTNDLTLGLAFLAGIVPSTVLRWIRESIEHLKNASQVRLPRGKPVTNTEAGNSGKRDDDFEDEDLTEKSPLSHLDDVDIYDRTRLEEEGITSVQALARHDLVDLILSSRIPVPRLIDWLDQAVLHQHAPGAVPTLRGLGIRTATDYLRVCGAPAALADMTKALRRHSAGVRVDLLRCVLEGDEWVRYIQNWRAHDGTERPKEKIFDARILRSKPGYPNDRVNTAPGVASIRRAARQTPLRTYRHRTGL